MYAREVFNKELARMEIAKDDEVMLLARNSTPTDPLKIQLRSITFSDLT